MKKFSIMMTILTEDTENHPEWIHKNIIELLDNADGVIETISYHAQRLRLTGCELDD